MQQRDLVKELIQKSLVDGSETIVLVMPRQGNPLIATSVNMDTAELANRIRGWAGLLENCIQNHILIPAPTGKVLQ